MIGELFTQYKSDKDTEHSYGAFYSDLFEGIRNDVKALLEIGIAWGGSLRAWRDYFPHAMITGIDHHADLVTEDRIESFRADSTDRKLLDDILQDRKFDIIIDDGCHWQAEQTSTYHNLYPRLNPGGIYVIEDVQSYDAMRDFAIIGADIVDRRPVKGRGDDILAVFRKPKE